MFREVGVKIELIPGNVSRETDNTEKIWDLPSVLRPGRWEVFLMKY